MDSAQTEGYTVVWVVCMSVVGVVAGHIHHDSPGGSHAPSPAASHCEGPWEESSTWDQHQVELAAGNPEILVC